MLIIKKDVKGVIKLYIRLFLGRMIFKLYNAFKLYEVKQAGYNFTASRMSGKDIKMCDQYVADAINSYKFEQEECGNIEKLSEYYLYQRISERKRGPVTICNIGCFYCGADSHFLDKHPGSAVYGLDFGDIITANKNIKLANLKLFPGYPLHTLEEFAKNGEQFDYAIFTRTATLINVNELFSYMEVLKRVAKNICFLEIAKSPCF